MKKLVLIISVLLFTSVAFAAKDTIRNNGLRYTPDSISIFEGDTVVWIIFNSHDAVEVDSTTWAANGATSNNGFSIPFGGGSHVFNTAGKYFYVCTPHAGLSMKGIITVLPNTTSIPEEQLKKLFSFYPNPAKDQLTVKIPQFNDYELLEVVNPLGQIVYSKTIRLNKELIDLSGFMSGVYFINLRSEEAIFTQKLIVE